MLPRIENSAMKDNAKLLQEMLDALCNIAEPHSKKLCGLILTNDDSVAEVDYTILKEKIRNKKIKYMPTLPDEGVLETNIVMYTQMATKIDGFWEQAVKVDISVPNEHWPTESGPRPLVIGAEIEMILNGMRVVLGELVLLSFYIKTFDPRYSGYTLEFRVKTNGR